MLTVALELQRRSDAAGWGIHSTAAHPGLAKTEIVAHGPGIGTTRRPLMQTAMALGLSIWGQSAEKGAAASVVAAVADIPGGAYIGPTGFREMWGPLGHAKIAPQARSRAIADALWSQSEQLTGVTFGAY